MIKHKLTELLESNDIVMPTLLGKSVRIENDPQVYQVIDTRWRSQEIVLRDKHSDKTFTLPGADFFKMAIMITD